ncbi:MAG: hypothetical protein EBT92_10800 [Planctomycetes bacterium]|nr:hypothetical protein [Planctomycetota bacterium]NBY01524.1 hypothetical protein [Planctomycetota bacterium]
MFMRYMILILLFFVLVNSRSNSSQISQSSISEMIQSLGNASFELREKAEKDLELVGEPALEQLRKARKSEDPEIRRRTESLIKKIETESDNKKLIAPRRITMKHTDIPVTEVIADLVKQSGYRIVLEDKSRALESKKITVEMKDASFWEALQTISAKANLVQVAGLQGTAGNPIKVEFPKPNIFPRAVPKVIPAVPEKAGEEPKIQPKKGVKKDTTAKDIQVLFVPQEKAQPVAPPPVLPQPVLPPGIGQVFGQVAIGMDQAPVARGKENVIILKEGNVESLPTDNSSAFRIRLLKNPENIFGKPHEKHLLIGLEVTPEPRMKLQAITSVNITKAMDESGQILEQDTTVSRNEIVAPPMPGRIIAKPIQELGQEGKAGAIDSKAPIHFLKGQKGSKSIQILEGKLVLQVLDDSKPILEITNIEKEVGKKIEGKSGAWLKINECGKDAKGLHSLRFEYDIPSDAVAGNIQNNRIQLGNIGIQNNIIVQNGQVNFVGGAAPVNLGGFKILDADGKSLVPNSSSTSIQVGPAGTKRSINVTYPASLKAPFKIVYDGGASTSVEVPFSLKLVPLQ